MADMETLRQLTRDYEHLQITKDFKKKSILLGIHTVFFPLQDQTDKQIQDMSLEDVVAAHRVMRDEICEQHPEPPNGDKDKILEQALHGTPRFKAALQDIEETMKEGLLGMI